LDSPSGSSHYSPYFSSPEYATGSSLSPVSPLSFYHIQDREIWSPKGPFDFAGLGTPNTPYGHDEYASVDIESEIENGTDEDLFSSPRSTENSSVARPTKPLMKGFISSPSFLEEEVSSALVFFFVSIPRLMKIIELRRRRSSP